MLLFYTFLGILIVGIILLVIAIFTHSDVPFNIGIAMAALGTIVVIILGTAILSTKASIPAEKQKNLYTYNTYKERVKKIKEAESKDRYSMAEQILFNEINTWNQNYLKYMEYSKNPWINAFFPEECYEGIDGLIELPN